MQKQFFLNIRMFLNVATFLKILRRIGLVREQLMSVSVVVKVIQSFHVPTIIINYT